MSVVAEYIPQVLQLTERAVAKLKNLVEEEGNPELKLRVYVTGGGCSGFQYGFSFEDEAAEDDTLRRKRRRDCAGRSAQLPISGRLRSRLSGRAGRFAFRHQQPQCQHDLRLRLVVLHLSGK